MPMENGLPSPIVVITLISTILAYADTFTAVTAGSRHDRASVTAFPNGQQADRQSIDVAADIPGYGGLWIDSAGNIHALVVDLRYSERLRARIAPLLPRIIQGGELARQNLHRRVIIEKVSFDLRQLSGWKRQIFSVVKEFPSFSGIGLSQRFNRVDVGLEKEGDVERVRIELAKVGVPPEAVNVQVRAKAKLL